MSAIHIDNKSRTKHPFCVCCQYTSARCSPFLDRILLYPRETCGCGNHLLELIIQPSLSFFHVTSPSKQDSLLGRFIHGNDSFRNARLKLIPRVALGPWVVQRAVGTKPLIVGRALKVTYHSSPNNYMEVDIDIGSSTVANNIVRFVLGYVRTLVVDMCFLIEGKRDDELPEQLIGTSRVAHLEPESAVAPPPVR
mmetsp:Transcript_8062/g.36648  ORF Transcript_8062/g.36648 Transcript_8062/m.36648 type:complete len:195 (+) Transcript_8062:1973-2557(+)